MAEKAAELLSQALRLSAAERAALADSLIESLDTEVDADAERAWRVEIRRRAKELESDALETIAWEDARETLREEFG